MARYKKPESTEFGSDSFLDIIANVVGILIILVMVTGVRVKLAPASADPPPAAPRQYGLEEQRRRVEKLAGGVADAEHALAGEDQRLAAGRRAIDQARNGLEERQARLEADAAHWQDAERFRRELEELLAADKARLGGLLRDRAAIPAPKKDKHEIVSYPTPLSHGVDGPEIHFQLKDGLVAHVPMRTLVEGIIQDFRVKVGSRPEARMIEGKVGPAEQFDLTYVMVLEKGVFVPLATRLGESLDQALAPNSRFRQVLYSGEHDRPIGNTSSRYESTTGEPQQITVTLWTYPDSFALYRRLKQELYLEGFAVAGRPMPFGTPIAGARTGTQSQAQ
jgi:hypothetical protein